MTAPTWYEPAPGTTAHRVRTTVRGAGLLTLAGYLAALATYIPS